MARSTTPAIPPDMYRHFAIATLVITGVMALFADGESRSALAEQVEQERQELAARARRGEDTPPKFESVPPPVPRHDEGPGFSGPFGSPMSTPVVQQAPSIVPEDALERAGYSRAYLQSLTEEERLRLLEGLRQSGMLGEAERQRQSSALLEASARRSGAPITAG